MFTVDAILNQYYPRLAGRPLIDPFEEWRCYEPACFQP